jgi:hypothetical protein
MYARSRLALLATVVLPLLVLIASCGDDNDADISPAQTLIGTWEFDTRATITEIQINEDGSYQVMGPATADQEPFELGQYEIEGDLIILRGDDDNLVCAGETGQYRLTFDGTDTVDFEKVEDECAGRAGQFFYSQLVRASG